MNENKDKPYLQKVASSTIDAKVKNVEKKVHFENGDITPYKPIVKPIQQTTQSKKP